MTATDQGFQHQATLEAYRTFRETTAVLETQTITDLAGAYSPTDAYVAASERAIDAAFESGRLIQTAADDADDTEYRVADVEAGYALLDALPDLGDGLGSVEVAIAVLVHDLISADDYQTITEWWAAHAPLPIVSTPPPVVVEQLDPPRPAGTPRPAEARPTSPAPPRPAPHRIPPQRTPNPESDHQRKMRLGRERALLKKSLQRKTRRANQLGGLLIALAFADMFAAMSMLGRQGLSSTSRAALAAAAFLMIGLLVGSVLSYRRARLIRAGKLPRERKRGS